MTLVKSLHFSLIFTFHLALATYRLLPVARLFLLFCSLFQERGLDCGVRVAATQERIHPHAKIN